MSTSHFYTLCLMLCRLLGLDLVPRQESEQVDVDRTSAVELFSLHELSSQNMQDATVSTQ